ncbi:MAG: hypothetical protein ABFE07_27675 [Armatimonadia bacterium]
MSSLQALVTPAALVTAALTALGVYLVGWWFIIPGATVYGLIAYNAGPGKRKHARRIEELGLDLRDAPPGLKRWNTVLHETLARIEADLRRGEGDQARLLKPVGAEVEALGADIRRLIRQAHTLHRYLAATNIEMLNARIAHLDSQVAVTEDAYSKQQLVEAAEALRRQIGNCERIRVLIGRTEATLETMQASLQSIGSSVVRLTAGDLPDVTYARQDSLDRLASARSTVSALEDVLEQVELA